MLHSLMYLSILLVTISACLRTIPADGARISASSLSIDEYDTISSGSQDSGSGGTVDSASSTTSSASTSTVSSLSTTSISENNDDTVDSASVDSSSSTTSSASTSTVSSSSTTTSSSENNDDNHRNFNDEGASLTFLSRSDARAFSRHDRGSNDYKNHIKQFHSASSTKTFKSRSKQFSHEYKNVPGTSGEARNSESSESQHHKHHQKAITFTSHQVSEQDHHISDSDAVKDDNDLFQALNVEKTDICSTCPSIWMNNHSEMKEICANYESVSNFFSMTLDRQDAVKIEDQNDVKECTRVITCSQPNMLVKWHDSDLCDVHAPSTGAVSTDDSSNNFVYKCNGTHWTMHGFPLKSVICAVSTK